MKSESRHAAYESRDISLSLTMGGRADSAPAHEADQVSASSVRELSHDLRHPCATIRALAAAIEIEAELPEAAANRLHQIVAEARRVEELCSQVLASSAGAKGITRIDRVVRDIVAVHPRVSAVTVPLAARVPELDLRRILWNLIDNALRAAGPDGNVVVSAWSDDDRVIVAVSDDGPGFGAGPDGAAGLGLGIVRALAEKAGGRMQVVVADRPGVEIRIVLPHPVEEAIPVPGFDRADAVAGERS